MKDKKQKHEEELEFSPLRIFVIPLVMALGIIGILFGILWVINYTISENEKFHAENHLSCRQCGYDEVTDYKKILFHEVKIECDNKHIISRYNFAEIKYNKWREKEKVIREWMTFCKK